MADPFSDPRNQALIAFGSGLMARNGPSLTPVSFGQSMGGAMQDGLTHYKSAHQQQLAEQLREAQIAEMKRKAAQEEEQRRIRGVLMQGMGMDVGQGQPAPMGALSGYPRGVLAGDSSVPTGPNRGGLYGDPDKIEALGTYLALSGDAGAATLLGVADKIRTRNEDKQTAEGFKSKPGVLGAGVTTNSPQGRALLSNLSGNQEFDNAVLSAQNEALNSNQKLRPQAIQAPRPGLFSPLAASPYVGQHAQQLQSQLDNTTGLKPQQWLSQNDRLQQQDQTATNAATARGETAELRRELAGQADGTRRMLAGMAYQQRQDKKGDLDDQRQFSKERSLANDYNGLSKDFRVVRPAFESAAQYVAGNKYDSSGDRALVFQYARTLDPKDRVGVQDIRDITKLGNVPERIQQAIVGLASGNELPPRVRLEMFNAMRSRFENMNNMQAEIEDEYEKRAKSYMLKPDNVVTRYSVKKKPGAGNGASGGWSATEKP